MVTAALERTHGAGKSTLLLLAAGLEPATAGEVLLGDQPVTSLSASLRRDLICYVGPRSPILAGSLRRALTMGVGGAQDDEHIARVAGKYGLTPVIERLGRLDGTLAEGGRTLSSGELRRLHLARSVVSGPALLLLDEPDDALDQDGPALVDKLVRECGATTLLVTHNHGLARRMGSAWWVENGGIALQGTPRSAA